MALRNETQVNRGLILQTPYYHHSFGFICKGIPCRIDKAVNPSLQMHRLNILSGDDPLQNL